jgi:hypothetical protein
MNTRPGGVAEKRTLTALPAGCPQETAEFLAQEVVVNGQYHPIGLGLVLPGRNP